MINWMRMLMWLVYGAIIGLPLTAVSMATAPMFSGHSVLMALHYVLSFMLLGLWARFIVRNVHILGG